VTKKAMSHPYAAARCSYCFMHKSYHVKRQLLMVIDLHTINWPCMVKQQQNQRQRNGGKEDVGNRDAFILTTWSLTLNLINFQLQPASQRTCSMFIIKTPV